MLISMKSMLGYRLSASDGAFGTLRDFHFDDRSWTLRNLVAATGILGFGREVLIPRDAIVNVDWVHKMIYVRGTKEQLRRSPRIDEDAPIYRQFETQLKNYYEWAAHWTPRSGEPEPQTELVFTGDPHRRSLKHLMGYGVDALDGPVGHVADFVVDDADWRLGLVVIDTSFGLDRGHAALATDWIDGFSWDERSVAVGLPRIAIENGPEYSPLHLADADYEKRLHEYYGRAVQPAYEPARGAQGLGVY